MITIKFLTCILNNNCLLIRLQLFGISIFSNNIKTFPYFSHLKSTGNYNKELKFWP